jgi:hypothetical protein
MLDRCVDGPESNLYVNTCGGHNAEVFSVKAYGIYSDHCALKGWESGLKIISYQFIRTVSQNQPPEKKKVKLYIIL